LELKNKKKDTFKQYKHLKNGKNEQKCVLSCDLLLYYYLLEDKILSSDWSQLFHRSVWSSTLRIYNLLTMPISQQPIELYIIFYTKLMTCSFTWTLWKILFFIGTVKHIFAHFCHFWDVCIVWKCPSSYFLIPIFFCFLMFIHFSPLQGFWNCDMWQVICDLWDVTDHSVVL
jgi:hypothetical protein